jgi:tetratricopeptide (TPR) repeat protein
MAEAPNKPGGKTPSSEEARRPLPAAPTDEEIFGIAELAELSEPESLLSPLGDDGERTDPGQELAELEPKAGPAVAVPGTARALADAARAPAPARRGPAVVRRDSLALRGAKGERLSVTKPQAVVRDPGGFAGEESTRIADVGLLEKFAVAADEPLSGLEGPTVDSLPMVQLDESFYDGIEIGSAATSDEEEAARAQPSPTPSPLPVRTVSRHVVRREVRAAPEPVVTKPEQAPAHVEPAGTPAAPEAPPEREPVAVSEPIPFFEEWPADDGEDDAWAPGVDLSEPLPDTPPLSPRAELGRSRALDVDPSAFSLPEISPGRASPLPLEPRFLSASELAELCGALLPDEATRPSELQVACGIFAAAEGDSLRAHEHFAEARKEDPASLAALRGQRRVCLAEGRDREALACLAAETELASGEELFALRLLRAELCAALGETDAAYQLSLPQGGSEDLRALVLALLVSYTARRDEQVIDVAQRLASLVDDAELKAALHLLCARTAEKLGHMEGALASFTAAFEANPGSRGALLGLARRKSQTSQASHHGHHPKTTPETEAAAALGRFLEGVTDVALIASVGRRRATALVLASRLDLAAQALEEALEGAPLDPLVLESMADLARRDGSVVDASRWSAEWARVEPQPARQAQAWRQTATLLSGPHADPVAIEAAWEALLLADPQDPLAPLELQARHEAPAPLVRTRAWERAKRALADGDPEGAGVVCLRAAAHLSREGQSRDAIALLEALREEVPAMGAFELATLELAEGRYEACAEVLAEVPTQRGLLCRARAADRQARRFPGDAAAWDRAQAAWDRVDDGPRAQAKLALWRLPGLSTDEAAYADALSAVARSARDAALEVTAALCGAEAAASAEERQAAARRALETWPADPRTRVLAMRLVEPQSPTSEGEWAEIATVRMDALPEGTERDALGYLAATSYVQAGHEARAAEHLAGVVRRRPGWVFARVLLEGLYRRLGDVAGLTACLVEDAREPAREVAGTGARALATARRVCAGETLLDQIGGAQTGGAQTGGAVRATSLLRTALAAAPHEPLVRDAVCRAAEAAGETALLADLALTNRTRAEELGDVEGQIAAYEELARIDAELRGDVASSTLAWSAIVDLAAHDMTALRALERYYVAEGRTEETLGIYAQIAAALGEAKDREAVLLLRSRQHAGALASAEALSDYRAVRSEAPLARQALFFLEARAHDVGAKAELAELEEAVAAYFGEDPRASACFLTRAAEVRAELGEHDLAVERFRRAADVGHGHVPALWAWRRLALSSGRYREVAETAEREAAVVSSDPERVALHHLGGVALMDGAQDPAASVAPLRRVLGLCPTHEDAFLRLRALYRTAERHEELAELYVAKIAVEPSARRRCAYHQELAELYRDALSDPARAKAQLREALALEEHNLEVLMALGELTWNAGEWSDAADALLRQAKLDKNPETLKACFYRLGVIYSEHLPDARWAVKSFEQVIRLDPNDTGAFAHLSALSIQLGDFRSALPLTEKLLTLVADPGERITYLHRLASIHEHGSGDRRRTEDAHRAALETDPTSQVALAALIEYFQRVKDAPSLRIHLDRLAGAMRARLAKSSLDGVAYRVLGRALAVRAHVGVPASVHPARAALELAHALGCAEEQDRVLLGETLRPVASARGLGDLAVDESLFHSSIPNGFRQVFRLLHEILGKRFPPDLRRYGVGKADKLPVGHAVRDVVAGLAVELGVTELDVYVSPVQAAVAAVEVGEPMALVLGADLVAGAKAPQLRFAAGRAIKLAASYLAIAARLSVEELGTLLGGLIRLYEAGFAPGGLSETAVDEEQQRLTRLLAKRLRDELAPFVNEIAGLKFDPKALWWGLQHTGNRAGLLACGSVLPALTVLARTGGHKNLEASRGDVQIVELLRFSVSDEYGELRKSLP